MEYTTPTEPIDEFWRSQTQQSPKRYQAWLTDGKFRSFLGAGHSKKELMTAAFVTTHTSHYIAIIDTQGVTKRRTPAGDPKTVPGAVVARQRWAGDRGWYWMFYSDWKEKREPTKVARMRHTLKLVVTALKRPKDATAAFLASEAGLKERTLAKLLDLSAEGEVKVGSTCYDLPKVGVRIERDPFLRGAWLVVAT